MNKEKTDDVIIEGVDAKGNIIRETVKVLRSEEEE